MHQNISERIRKEHRQSGFTIIFASLVASLILTMSLILSGIALKESRLSSLATLSQYAIYASDSGAECALYWDLQRDAFNPLSGASSIECAGQVLGGMGGGGAYPAVESFTIVFPPQNYCAEITITKTSDPFETVLVSKGYNTCDPSARQRVERKLEVRY